MNPQRKRLLICDLDNTLYDWVGYFVPALYAMVDSAVELLQCDREVLLNELKLVHQDHKDSEHPFALLETPTVLNAFPECSRSELKRKLDPAFYAFNSTRKRTLHLYPGVRATLDLLQRSGFSIVAHTESKLTGVMDRLIRLEIIQFFDRIYCRQGPSTEHPDPEAGRRWMEKMPREKIVELSHHQQKPAPSVLLEICDREGAELPACTYVGDSIARDIYMAKQANIAAVWAKYGAVKDELIYQMLVRVTHWSAYDVEREKQLRQLSQSVKPDYVLENGFSEILPLLKEHY